MAEVVQALEGAIAPMDCFGGDAARHVACSHRGRRGHGCATKLLWTRVQGGVLKALRRRRSPSSSTFLRQVGPLQLADLEIKNLHVSAGDKEILKGLDLEVSSGEIHALMGPNGSGKSTLANVIMGHPNLEVTEGQIRFEGEDITEADPGRALRAGLFMAFQYPVAIPA